MAENKGNPYHDKEGKFTTKENQGSATENISTSNTIKLKAGVDLSNFPSPGDIKVPSYINNQEYNGKVNTNVVLTFPTSLEDAMSQGNSILGSKSVFYKDIDLEMANQLNEALLVVIKDFPEIFQDRALLGYGNYFDYDFGGDEKKAEEEMCRKLLNQPQWRKVLASCGYSLEDVLSDFISNLDLSSWLQKKKKLEKDIGGFNAYMAYKIVGRSIHYYANGEAKDTAIRGGALIPQSAIKINQDYKTAESLDRVYRASFLFSNLHLSYGDKSGAYAIATHELGHSILYRLGRFMSDDEWNAFWNLTEHPRILFNSGEISRYAATNRHEQVAEAIADWYCRGENATRHNKEVFKFLKEVYDRIYATR